MGSAQTAGPATTTTTTTEAAGTAEGLVATGLTKRWGTVLAVDDLSLEAHPGEILALLGPNGAGKTTTIRMLCGLLAPDAGNVRLGGIPVTATRETRMRVGICPQEVVVWDKLTCVEQLAYVGSLYGLGGRAARRRAHALLEQLDLAGKATATAATLSGGMRRRLNLALGLVHDPEIIVLDEPAAGLDLASRVLVRALLRDLAAHRTLIMTTHDMDEADRLADRVAVIDHGRLLAVDTPEALKSAVGAGDVLEIEVARPPRSLDVPFRVRAGRVEVRALNAIRLVAPVVARLEETECEPGAVRLRPNSLEDVFGALTEREPAP